MSKKLIYSVLQYKHSALLNEAINVGVLFYFPEDTKKLYFRYATPDRIRAIYTGFDLSYYNALLKLIKNSVEKCFSDVLARNLLEVDFQSFIDSYILRPDDSVLQFSHPFSGVHVWDTAQEAADRYTTLLLPQIKQDVIDIRKDDSFVTKKFKSYFNAPQKKKILKHISKPQSICISEKVFKFDLSWQNGSLNLIKPLSFDLVDGTAIFNKAAMQYGYLAWINDYLSANNCCVDFLVYEPQDKSLIPSFEESIRRIEDIDARKKIIRFNEIEEYAIKVENTLRILHPELID